MVYTDCLSHARAISTFLLVHENYRGHTIRTPTVSLNCFRFFFIFFIGAIGEEIGWSGYSIEKRVCDGALPHDDQW